MWKGFLSSGWGTIKYILVLVHTSLCIQQTQNINSFAPSEALELDLTSLGDECGASAVVHSRFVCLHWQKIYFSELKGAAETGVSSPSHQQASFTARVESITL